MSFAQLNLDSHISKALSICGYNQPTPIQEQCIPSILNGKDVVASAQTGTGKTAAFLLPALNKLSVRTNTQDPRVLILTPTRELANQITTAAAKYGKFLKFKMASLVGGMGYREQIRDLSRSLDMVVATPGRLLDHVDNGRLNLSGVEMLILDEADRMLDMGFIEDMQIIAKMIPNHRQTLLFSATVDNKLMDVVKTFLKNPVRIDLSEEKLAPSLIKQEVYMTDDVQHKNELLNHFIKNHNIFKGIIFSSTKIHADKLAKELRDLDLKALPLHGDLKQSIRNKTVEQLRKGKIQFIVATDVAARGIDISDVTHVINFNLPRFWEDYVHRIGRTGRAGKKGQAISFVMPNELRLLQKIEHLTGQKLEKMVIEGLEPTMRKSSTDYKKKKKRGDKSFGKKPKSFSSNHEFRREKGFRKDKDFGKEKDFAKGKDYRKEPDFRKEKDFGKRKDFRNEQDFSREDRDTKKPFVKTKRSFANQDSRSTNQNKNFIEKKKTDYMETERNFSDRNKRSESNRHDRSDSNKQNYSENKRKKFSDTKKNEFFGESRNSSKNRGKRFSESREGFNPKNKVRNKKKRDF